MNEFRKVLRNKKTASFQIPRNLNYPAFKPPTNIANPQIS